MARRRRLEIHLRGETRILALGDMEIWDGADLSLLRETLNRLIEEEKCRAIGVDMTYVKYVPSGFFGMLYDWHEKGVVIRLYSPQPRVRNMLWFRQFFDLIDEETHLLHNGPSEVPTPETVKPWSEAWDTSDEDEQYAAGKSN